MSGPAPAIIRGKGRRVIVVGSGASGLSVVLELLRGGASVLQLSSGPARQAPSAASQEGIAVALEQSIEQRRHHRAATLSAAPVRAGLPLVEHLVEAAPELARELEALGVPFCREPSGELCSAARDALPIIFSGATTGQQVVQALERPVRALHWNQGAAVSARGELATSWLDRLEYWDVLGLIQDDQGVVIGVLACEQRTLELRALAADAVCLATGGASGLFGQSGGFGASGAAMGAALRAGAVVADLGRIAWEPTCLDGAVKRPLGSLLRGLGARLSTTRGKGRARSPGEVGLAAYDEWSARDEANADAACEAACRGSAQGIPWLLDLSHLDPEETSARASWALELIRTFGNVDPWARPVPVVPCPAGSRGGLWVDCETDRGGRIVADSPRSQATSVPGLYAAGGVEWLCGQVGALPGNRLSAAILAGRLAGAGMLAYQNRIRTAAFELPQSVFDRALEALDARLVSAKPARVERPSTSTLDLQRRLVSIVTRVARADGTASEWRDALATLDEEMATWEALDSERRQSPERRAAQHWDGLSTVARALLESVARAPRGGDEVGPPVLLRRCGAAGFERVDGFEYRCAGQTVAIAAETGTSLPRAADSTRRGDGTPTPVETEEGTSP